jgi:hypothetical protein
MSGLSMSAPAKPSKSSPPAKSSAARSSSTAGSSLVKHRAQKARAGFIRVEVSVRKEDAGLLRDVARALSDPARAVDARKILRLRFTAPPRQSLKALLAAAPLDGIDVSRHRDFGGDVDL